MTLSPKAQKQIPPSTVVYLTYLKSCAAPINIYYDVIKLTLPKLPRLFKCKWRTEVFCCFNPFIIRNFLLDSSLIGRGGRKQVSNRERTRSTIDTQTNIGY